MSQFPTPVDDAAQALAEVRARHDQVITDATVPPWFWSAIGVLMLGFFAAIESHRPIWVITGSIGYALGLGAMIGYLTVSRRLQVRSDLLGVRGAMAIVAFTLVLVGIGLGLGLGLEARGLAWPATLAGIVVALGMAVGGPLLMRYLRTIMRSRAAVDTR